jgi:propionyl-CoA synthetase
MGLHSYAVKYGSPTKAVPGWDLQVVDEGCNPLAPGETGALVVKLPLPPGTLPTLWQNDERFLESYMKQFPGYYKTADAGYIDEEGYAYVMSRTDDIINVAGHRLSTGAMEEVLADHPDVAECAVLGVADKLKGQIPVGFMVLNAGVQRQDEEIVKEVIQMVRERIGPVAAFKTATVVKRLPKTRSGKILRGTIQKIADDAPWKMPATIDDPTILGEMAEALGAIGYGKAKTQIPN